MQTLDLAVPIGWNLKIDLDCKNHTKKQKTKKLLGTLTDKNERVHFNMGMLAMDDKNIEEAESWFRRAVHLKLDFRSALFNLALLLADDQRPLEAASFLNQLVKYHPDHTKGLILLGDIYINHVKDLDAAENVITFKLFS